MYYRPNFIVTVKIAIFRRERDVKIAKSYQISISIFSQIFDIKFIFAYKITVLKIYNR